MRIENSDEYERKMAAESKKRQQKEKRASATVRETRASGVGRTWTSMDECPLEAVESFDGTNDRFLVTDGKSVTVASVHKRFGTPVFYKKSPTMVWRDGFPCMEGGEVDPRDDLPKWWWKYELIDELESNGMSYGDMGGKPEIDFVPTFWMWLPEPPSAL